MRCSRQRLFYLYVGITSIIRGGVGARQLGEQVVCFETLNPSCLAPTFREDTYVGQFAKLCLGQVANLSYNLLRRSIIFSDKPFHFFHQLRITHKQRRTLM